MSELLNTGVIGSSEAKPSSEIKRIWDKTGLLEGLPEDLKEVSALKLEQTAGLMLNVTRYKNSSFDVIIFPIVRRVISEFIKNNLDISKIQVEFILIECERLFDITFAYTMASAYREIDAEAETCLLLSEKIYEFLVYNLNLK